MLRDRMVCQTDQPQCLDQRGLRAGVTILEVVTACALLGVAMTLTVQGVGAAYRNSRAADYAQRAEDWSANLMERCLMLSPAALNALQADVGASAALATRLWGPELISRLAQELPDGTVQLRMQPEPGAGAGAGMAVKVTVQWTDPVGHQKRRRTLCGWSYPQPQPQPRGATSPGSLEGQN